MNPTISREELQLKMTSGRPFVLVETLAPSAYNHAHLPGAVNIPPSQIAQLAPNLLPDLSADIVVYCATPT